MPDTPTLLVEALCARAATFAGAATMPADVYRCPDFLAVEETRIFARAWMCAGRADEIPAPGDYLTATVAHQPIVVMRGDDGRIRAFANVCLHRMMRLLDGGGNCARIVCPYHAWSYDRSGRLVAAPEMDRTPGFCVRDRRLPGVRTEIWQGWIYVTLNADAQPIAAMLAELAPLAARYGQSAYVSVLTEEHVWDTNWKLLTENFMECYHLPVAHRKTIGDQFSMKAIEFPVGGGRDFSCQTFMKTDTAPYGIAHPGNTRLTGSQRRQSLMPTVFPCHMYVLAPDHLWYLALTPAGVDRVRIRFGVALAPEVHAALAREDGLQQEIATLRDFFASVNAEDRYVVEQLYKNTAAPLSTPGPLCWLERGIHDFTQYLARTLIADRRPQGERDHARAPT